MGRAREEFDVVFYSVWIGPLLGATGGPSPGGAETQVLLIARLLAESGHSVCILTAHGESPPPAEVDGIRVISYPYPDVSPSRVPFVRALRVARDRWRRFAGVSAKAIVRRLGGAEAAVIWLVARLKRSRFVYSSASDSDFDHGRIEKSRLRVRLLNFAIRHADEVVVQTPGQEELCRTRFGRTPALIRSVADPVESPPGEPEAFLWAGRLASYKGPEAFLDLAAAVPEARFRMVGVEGGDADPALARAVRERAPALENLELLAEMPRADLLGLIARAAAVVSTSEFEGMPNVFLEGWARGVPAVSLNHDPGDVIRTEGLGKVAEGSSERLAEAVRELWRNGRDTEMSRRCLDYVRTNHAAEVVGAQWADVLRLPPAQR